MIKSIAHEYHFTLTEISNMYCDDKDFLGLYFWLDALLELEKSMKTK